MKDGAKDAVVDCFADRLRRRKDTFAKARVPSPRLRGEGPGRQVRGNGAGLRRPAPPPVSPDIETSYVSAIERLRKEQTAQKPVTTFLHLTDFHVSDPALADGDLLTDTGARLGEMLDMIAAMERKPAFAVVSGDLTNHGDVASYRHLRARLAGIGLPLLYALGNHDTRPGFYQGMLDRGDDLEAPYCHEAVIEGVHVVVLDSSVPGRIGGALDEASFAFLERALETHPGLAKILVLHHAPALDATSQLPWETLGQGDSARLAAAIRGRTVAGILCGHVHVDRVAVWNGVPVVVGTGLHNAFDPLFSGGLRAVAGAGFALCTLRPGGLAVTFVPLPSDRRELAILSEEKARAFR